MNSLASVFSRIQLWRWCGFVSTSLLVSGCMMAMICALESGLIYPRLPSCLFRVEGSESLLFHRATRVFLTITTLTVHVVKDDILYTSYPSLTKDRSIFDVLHQTVKLIVKPTLWRCKITNPRNSLWQPSDISRKEDATSDKIEIRLKRIGKRNVTCQRCLLNAHWHTLHASRILDARS